jgi:NADH-quinone oxidoreductase subunit J
MVIFTNHPVFSLLFLISSFLSASILLFLMECEFLALIFITVYVGAIAVLFLFSIMMLDFKRNNLQKNLIKFLPVGIFFAFIMLLPIINSIYIFFPITFNVNHFYLKNNLNWFDFSDSISEIEALGQVLYTYFVLHFLLIGIILLVVLFGVVHLTSSSRFLDKNKQILFKQLAKSTKLN